MKKFLKQFIIAFVVLTILFLPVQHLLRKVGETRIFSGEEDLMKSMNTLVDPESPFFEAFSDSKRVNILLLGVNQGMTDTIMLGSYDMKNQRVDIISVPRDTYYPRPGVKSPAAKKINAIYHSEKNGGAVGTATAVSNVLMGMPIHYYAVIEYEDVENIVEAIGGVPMDIPFHMRYRDPTDKPPLVIDIPKGQQVLDGPHAVQFLRYRHGYAQGDIGRVKAQQEFMKSAFKQAISSNLIKVVDTVMSGVDSDLDVAMAGKIATKALGLSGEDIQTHMADGYPETVNGVSYWFTQDEKVKTMLEEVYALPSTTTDGAIEEN